MSDELNQQTGDAVGADVAEVQAVDVGPTVGGLEATPPADEARPWHGSDNPLEALFQWAQAEFAKLRQEA